MLFDIDENEIKKEIVFDSKERWWNCYTNLLAVANRDVKLPEHVIVKDETLREGLVVPSRKKIEISTMIEVADALEEAGFTELEVGFTAGVEEHREFALQLKKHGNKMKHSAHTRTWAKDWKSEIDGVLDAGADIVNLTGFGTAETEKFAIPSIEKDKLADLYGKQVAYSKSKNAFTSFMLSTNVTRQDIIYDCYKAVANAGVDRAYVADGYGVSTPEGIKYLTTWVKDLVGPDVEIGLHLHNDFGLATANGLAGVTAGANLVDASINGLGDRGGLTITDELVASLEVLYGVKTGIKLEKLKALSQLVAKVWGINVQPHKPVTGNNMYRHETDIHIAALLSGLWYAYNVIAPEVIGDKESLEFGPAALAKGELSAVGVKIKSMGLNATEIEFDQILNLIKDEIKRSPERFATEENVAKIIKTVIKSKK